MRTKTVAFLTLAALAASLTLANLAFSTPGSSLTANGGWTLADNATTSIKNVSGADQVYTITSNGPDDAISIQVCPGDGSIVTLHGAAGPDSREFFVPKNGKMKVADTAGGNPEAEGNEGDDQGATGTWSR